MNMTIYTDTSFTRPRETSLAQYGDEVLFASGPFAATERGLILPKAATFEEWQRAGLFFSTVGDAATWAMVDWLAWGEQQFGEESAQAFDEMDYSYGYLLNLRTLYAAFPPHRRRWPLGKSYYQAVLPLLPEAQEMILDAAVRRQMTRDEVRAEVRALPDTARRRPRPARQTPQSTMSCGQCGHEDALVRLASGADGNKPGARTAADDAPEAEEAAITAVFSRHDRNVSLEDDEDNPAAAPATHVMQQTAIVETCYGRQVVFRFDVAPNLREGQRVRLSIEITS